MTIVFHRRLVLTVERRFPRRGGQGASPVRAADQRAVAAGGVSQPDGRPAGDPVVRAAARGPHAARTRGHHTRVPAELRRGMCKFSSSSFVLPGSRRFAC